MRAWDRQPDESTAAYRAARLYFEAGPGRSLAGVATALRDQERIESGSKADQTEAAKPNETLRSWSAKYRWVERAEAFDRHFDRIFEQTRAAEAVNQATLLEQRRAKLAETEWLVSQGMLKRLTDMLSWPISETVRDTITEDGKTIHRTIISPTNWRLRDVAILARVACDLQRMSVGMPTRMGAQPFIVPGGDSGAVDQTQADADNGRIPPELAEVFRQEAARIALENAGLLDAQPD